MFWGIVVFSYFIYLEFKRSKDGRLRILIMELFLAKIFVYGVAGAYYLAWDILAFPDNYSLLLRLVINAPMVIVMWKLYWFIRVK